MPCCPEQEHFRLIFQGISRALASLERGQATCYGLTPQQAYTLDAIETAGSVSMKVLSDRLNVSTSTMTRNVEKLEEDGSVTRSRTSEDSRTVTVTLTDSGREKLRLIHDCYESYYGEILGALSEEERGIVLKGLGLLNKALQACCGK